MDDDTGPPPAKRLKTSDDGADKMLETTNPVKQTFTVEVPALPALSQPSAPVLPAKPRPSKQQPEERKTEHLNLHHLSSDEKTQAKQLATLFKVLNKKKKIVVIAGAGISVGAGIPDFRSSTGLFSTVKNDYKVKGSGKSMFDAAVYKTDQSTSDFHDMVTDLKNMCDRSEPTTFHHLLASLASSNRLLRLYTQNVDCIDTSLPPLATKVPLNNKGPWPKTIQLHGGLDKMVCQKCGAIDDLDVTLFKGPVTPECRECTAWEQTRSATGKRALGVGKLRPRLVLYNEHNPDADAIGAVTEGDLKTRPDALIVVGTSAKIPGVRRMIREMCGVVRDFKGGKTIWINEDPPPMGKDFDGIWDLVVQGDCERMARLANVQKWDMPPIALSQPLTSTGNWYGVSTPQSLLSDCSSPLSSAISVASDDELEMELERNLDGRNVLLEVCISQPHMSTPAASPQPKSMVKMASAAKAKTGKPKLTPKMPKTPPEKKAKVQKVARIKTGIAHKITTVFKTAKMTSISLKESQERALKTITKPFTTPSSSLNPTATKLITTKRAVTTPTIPKDAIAKSIKKPTTVKPNATKLVTKKITIVKSNTTKLKLTGLMSSKNEAMRTDSTGSGKIDLTAIFLNRTEVSSKVAAKDDFAAVVTPTKAGPETARLNSTEVTPEAIQRRMSITNFLLN